MNRRKREDMNLAAVAEAIASRRIVRIDEFIRYRIEGGVKYFYYPTPHDCLGTALLSEIFLVNNLGYTVAEARHALKQAKQLAVQGIDTASKVDSQNVNGA